MKFPFFKFIVAIHLLLFMGLMIPNELYAQDLKNLREKILNENGDLRNQGFEELRKLKPFPEEAIEWLVKGLDHSDEYNRDHYVRLLRSLGPKSKNAVPALIQLFAKKSKNSLARIEVPLALGDIGISSKLVLPELIRIVGDTHEETLIRHYAIRGLIKMGVDAQPANPTLKKLAGDASIKVLQVVSWEALAIINPEDKQWIPKLVEMAEGKHGERVHLKAGVYNTSYTPKHFGLTALLVSKNNDILQDLLKKMIRSDDPKKVVSVLSFTWKLDLSSQKEFIPDYYRLIELEPKNKFEKHNKRLALSAFLRTERDPKKIIPLLEKIQKEDPDPKLRKDAGMILKNIKQYSKQVKEHR